MAARPPHGYTKREPKKRLSGRAASKASGLTDELRAEIVVRLAMYDKVKDIHADLIERGIDISHPAIGNYQPGRSGRKTAQKWVDLFNKTREDFLAEIAAEPIANRAWRLRRLTELFEEATAKNEREEARKVLEQAAKEVGGLFTNLAKVQGVALPGQIDPSRTSTDEMRNMLADRLGPALAQLAAQQQPTKH